MYDSCMANGMEQFNKVPGNADDAHTHLSELAAKVTENWRTLTLNRKDERAWEKLAPEELEDMHTKIEGWIQTGEDELAARPSLPGKNNILDDWSRALTFQNERIKGLIDKKRAGGGKNEPR